MTFKFIAEALRAESKREVIEPTPYKNRKNIWGRYFSIWHGGRFYMISLHNCSDVPTYNQIAHWIEKGTATEEKAGDYTNENGVWGYYATIDTERGWIMASVSDTKEKAQEIHDDVHHEIPHEYLISKPLFGGRGIPTTSTSNLAKLEKIFGKRI